MNAVTALRPSWAAERPDPRYRILAPARYPWTFNGPRRSRHVIERRWFAPLNKISQVCEGITVFNPFPIRKFDLIHAFNRIPVGRGPFIIGFESHLPRAFGAERTSWFTALSRAMASDRCRGIVAISEHAADVFQRQHRESPHARDLFKKLSVRYPNVEIGSLAERSDSPHRPLRLCFIGNHFARKGGCVAVRIADLALKARLPVEVTIISALQVGGAIWTDPPDQHFFAPFLRLLTLRNVRWYNSIRNQDVIRIMRESDLTLLPTLSDTFGFSVLESMAQGTPVLATAQGALPELIDHGANGFLLPLPVNEIREWEYITFKDRNTRCFETIFADEVERLSHAAMSIIRSLLDTPELRATLRRGAHKSAATRFSSEDANVFWDNYYSQSVERLQ